MSVFFINPFAFASADGDYESIATVTVGSGGASSIEFTSIPGTYQHLQIRMLNKDSAGTTWYNCSMQLNTDTGSNYATHILNGDGSSASSAGYASTAAVYAPFNAAGNKTYFAAAVIDILDYADTNKNTTVRSFSGSDQNGSGYCVLASGVWINTSAVTSIKFSRGVGGFVEHSTAALYGIKAP